nr:MAG: nucleocapsid protein [Hangzhou sesamia inferens peribunyavirus 1]
MAHYTFDQNVLEATFKGSDFYKMHINDLFLTDKDTVENILCQGKKIRQQLKTLQPGQTLTIGTAQISMGVQLSIKKGGPNVIIGDDEYTLNRLTGMCAAYATQQGSGFSPKCAMAIALGLDVSRDRILYYSAAPGSEHFTEIFTYHPLLCSIKQLELNKVSKENIARIAAVKNNAGKTLATLLTDNKPSLPTKLAKFGTGGSRGIVELEKALNVVKSLSGTSVPSTSR